MPAEADYDAADIDRELVSARLRQDVLEDSGKVYLFIANSVRVQSFQQHRSADGTRSIISLPPFHDSDARDIGSRLRLQLRQKISSGCSLLARRAPLSNGTFILAPEFLRFAKDTPT